MSRVSRRAEVSAKFRALPAAVRAEVAKVLRDDAAAMAGRMRRLAPSKTGALRRSIQVVKGDYKPANANVRGVGAFSGGDHELSLGVVAGDEVAWYARLVEFGTPARTNSDRGMFPGAANPGTEPQPFFFPVFRSEKKRIVRRVGNAARKAIRKHGV